MRDQDSRAWQPNPYTREKGGNGLMFKIKPQESPPMVVVPAPAPVPTPVPIPVVVPVLVPVPVPVLRRVK